jgi:uncharacterized membrane protein YeaQ/YmgE (transglycosylase-associated protein family)
MRGFFMATVIAWFVHIVLCAVMGWVASHLLGVDEKHSVGTNIAAGLGGAWIASLIFKGGLISREPTLFALFAAFSGALIVVALLRFVRTGTAKRKR